MIRTIALSILLAVFCNPVAAAGEPEDLRARAEAGDAAAQASLGEMYDSGQGVAQDYRQAMHWYALAAGQGHILAQYELGRLYVSEEAGTQDFDKAAYWWEKAASSGLMEAQFHLGNLYYYGLTGQKNLDMARKWLALAAQQGSPFAQESLARIEVDGKQISSPSPRSVGSESTPPASAGQVRREAWILAQPAENYTIQILSSDSESAVLEHIRKNALAIDVAYLESTTQGAALFRVIYGSYPSRELADEAMASLPRASGVNSPWLRTFAQVQALVDRRYAQRGASE